MAFSIATRRYSLYIGIGLMAAIFAVDTLATIGGAIAVLYVLVLMLTDPSLSRNGLIGVASICVLLTAASFLLSHGEDWHDDATLRAIISLLAIAAATLLLLRNKASASSLAKQAALLDLSHDAIFVRDAGDIVTYWSLGAEKLYGWPADLAIGRNAHELLRTTFPAPLPAIMDIVDGSGQWDGELLQRRRDGTEIAVLSRWSIKRDAQGRMEALLETDTDISDRRRADQALRRSEAQLRAAQHLSQTGSISFDVVTDEISWSAESARIYGYEPDTRPTLERILERVHPDDLEPMHATIATARATHAAIDFEHRLLMPDGSVRHLHILAAPAGSAAGRNEMIGALRDETAERQAELALHKAQQELAYVTRLATLGELTASIAHEVNQPLAGVVGNGEAALRWMKREPPDFDEVRAAVTRMIADGRRASDVVNRVRALARRGASSEYQPLDLNEVIEETAALLDRELAVHGVKLEVEPAADLHGVEGDRIQLQQVLINLVVNGIQAIGEGGGVVTVRSFDEDGHAVVEVADSGRGIDPEIAGRLFEAFVTTKTTGMGMGLSICRSIMEAHGGRITPVAPAGRGAVFRIAVPWREEGAAR